MWAMRKNTGFTIVELLIVVVIIGILAAIVIVAYNGVTSKAHDTTVQSDLSSLVKKLEAEKVTLGRYPVPPTAAMGIRISKDSYRDQNNLYYCTDPATDRYAVQVRTINGNYFKIVDGVVSSGFGPSGYSGLGTCQILDAALTFGANASLGYDAATQTWASWAL